MNLTATMCGSFSLLAASVAGFAGSVHCLAMCGGISGALTLRMRRNDVSVAHTVTHSLTYQIGRLTSYSAAGALGAALIGVLPALLAYQALGLALRALAGFVLIAAAVGLLGSWRPLAPVERLGARLWRHLAPLTRNLPADRLASSMLLGVVWGWLPCGMVYAMVLVAALSGTAVRGAAIMLCFGLGTLPAVLSAGLASAQIVRWRAGQRLNTVFGALLLILGIMTVVAPWAMPGHSSM